MATHESIPAPRAMPLNCRNRKSRWQEFKEEFQDYAVFTDLYKENETKQMTAFRLHFGAHWRPKLKTLRLEIEQQADNTMEDLTNATEPCTRLKATFIALDKEFGGFQSVLVSREKFYKFSQGSQDVETFIDKLQELAGECDFPVEAKDEMIRDRLVFGVKSQVTKDRLMASKKIDLQHCLATVRRVADTGQSVSNEVSVDQNINMIRRSKSRSRNPKCKFCGSEHERDRTKCPASGKTCNKCRRTGHFASVCTKKNGRHRIHQVDTAETRDSSDEFSDGSSENEGYSTETTYVVQTLGDPTIKRIMISLRGKAKQSSFRLKAQVDTGASCNVLPLNVYENLRHRGLVSPLKQTSVRLKMYNGDIASALGRCKIECSNGKRSSLIQFEVADVTEFPLLSAESSVKLGCIVLGENVEIVNQVTKQDEIPSTHRRRLDELLQKHERVFEGLGKLPGKVKIHLQDNYRAVQCPPRKVPIALKQQIIERILQLERQRIIQRVKHDTPTPFISQMLVVAREGKKPRITLDPYHLNQATKRCHFRMPTLTDILPELTRARFFTVCDASDGFYQCVLDDKSTDLTTFWTPLGRFKYLRMPQGLNIAPEIYQAKQMEALDGLQGVFCVADDLLICGFGDSDEEALENHFVNLRKLFERCEEKNLKLNRSKLRLCTSEVKFLGHVLTRKGVSQDPEKTETIRKMLPPTDKKSLQRFLGAVNYHHSFIKDLSQMTAPLRELLKDKIVFVWGESQQKSFDELKEVLCGKQVLAYFDASKAITIRCDASNHGLGATLIQEGRPVDFCSTALRKAEKEYAVIEKELLSIVVACQKFEQYIIHHHNVTVETDHQPLVSIFRKPLYDTPKRLQRMLLRLQKYNFAVKYISGKNNCVADWLSRDMPLKPKSSSKWPSSEYIFRVEAENVDPEKLSIVKNHTLARIKEAAESDAEFKSLQEITKKGWPSDKGKCPTVLRSFWKYRSEIVESKGLLYKGPALFVPKSLRAHMLKIAHASHYGFRLLWKRARECVFWPTLRSQLEDYCNNCEACLSFQAKQAKEPMIQTTSATYPFQVVFQDLFEYNGENYMVTVDVFSDFFEVDRLGQKTNAAKIIQMSKRHFSRYGIPIELHTDNGPQFVSEEYKDFLSSWNITHITSSPYFAQSNGKAEAAVKVAKRLLKKCKLNDEDYEYGLLEIRNVPQTEGVSRAKKFFGRSLRSKLPSELDKGIVYDKQQVLRNKKKLEQRKKVNDKAAKPLKRLSRNATVRVQPLERHGRWKRGTCLRQIAPRSYNVKLDDGTVIRRNRRHLRESKEKPAPSRAAPQPSEPQKRTEKQGMSRETTQSNEPRKRTQRKRALDDTVQLRRSTRIVKQRKIADL